MMANGFLTIYRKDFTRKRIERVSAIRDVEKRDPIGDSFRKYLTLEDVDDYYEKAKESYNELSEITENKSVDKAVVKKNEMYNGRTVYQVEFCDLEKEIAYKEYARKNAVRLPADVFIPLTSQRAGYRQPILIDAQAYVKDVVHKPANSLDPNYKQRDILKTTTGVSEYKRVIGRVGKQIMVEQLHGVLKHLK